MAKVFEGTTGEYYLDGYLKENLTTAKEIIKKNWDMIFVVDGYEGSGKSTIAIQSAKYCDSNFDIDQVVFTPFEFRKAILNAKPYQAVVYDEAYTGLSSRSTMSMINRALVSMLAEIRQKNLFIFVVMPTFFDLDRYVAIWRSRALIHVYCGHNFQRGFFSFYNIDKKKDLYILGKKFYSYSKPKFNFNGRFVKHLPIDEKAYKQRKKDSLSKREQAAEDKQRRQEIENELFLRVMEVGDEVKHTIKMKILGLPPSTYFDKLKRFKTMQDLI